jgi:hypothetical protein
VCARPGQGDGARAPSKDPIADQEQRAPDVACGAMRERQTGELRCAAVHRDPDHGQHVEQRRR